MVKRNLTRREFLRFAGVSAGGVLFTPAWRTFNRIGLPQIPHTDRIGRVCVGKVDLKLRPDELSDTVGTLYEDALVPWLREAVGPKPYYINQRWVETPDGYIYEPYVQQVKNLPNQPVTQLLQTDLGEGMWAEVTVPYV